MLGSGLQLLKNGLGMLGNMFRCQWSGLRLLRIILLLGSGVVDIGEWVHSLAAE